MHNYPQSYPQLVLAYFRVIDAEEDRLIECKKKPVQSTGIKVRESYILQIASLSITRKKFCKTLFMMHIPCQEFQVIVFKRFENQAGK